MSRALPSETQVLISGAGPVGLALGVELGRRGVSCLIAEPHPTVSHSRPRCKTINVRTMEHLRRWGVAERLRAAAPLSPTWSQDVVFCTSLTGRELSRFTGVFGLDAAPERSPEAGQQAPQFVLEEVLREVAGELPSCDLALGSRVAGLVQGDDFVRVTLETAEGSREVRADYVVGCDGSRSVVRSQIGAAYVGDVALSPNFLTVFRAPDLWAHIPYGRAVHYWTVSEGAPGNFGSLDGGNVWWGSFVGVDQDRGEREIIDLIAAAIGSEVPFEVMSTDPWTAHMEVADRSRFGRVFLAGDAGHLTPPWGGHGMNTGFGDAVDLGWKLAATIDGWGGSGLLDSYGLERWPFAEAIIEESLQNMSVLSTDLLSDLIDEDGPAGDEARRRLDERIQETKAREFLSLEFVLGLGYPDSPIVVSGSGEGGPARPGHRLPHAWLADGEAVFDRLGPGFSLLHRDHQAESAGAFEAACRSRDLPLTRVDVGPLLDRDYGGQMVLVRPDYNVAWTGASANGDAGAILDTARGATA